MASATAKPGSCGEVSVSSRVSSSATSNDVDLRRRTTEDEDVARGRVDQPQLGEPVALIGGLLRADVVAPGGRRAGLDREVRHRVRTLVVARRRAALGVPEQVGPEDIVLVDQHVDGPCDLAAAGLATNPCLECVVQLSQDLLVREVRLLHDDLTLDELAAHAVVRHREVLLRRHALGNRHRVHRTTLLSSGPLLPRGGRPTKFAPQPRAKRTQTGAPPPDGAPELSRELRATRPARRRRRRRATGRPCRSAPT